MEIEKTPGDALYLVREVRRNEHGVTDEEYALFSDWWRGHKKRPVPRVMLPKLGVVVQECEGEKSEDVAALWLYMDNSVGVCFLERVVTRPGLSLRRSRRAVERGIDYLKAAAREMGYFVMLLRTSESIARIARHFGFHRDAKNVIGMSCALKEEK